MATISIAMRHSQGVTLQYVALTISDRAAITTRLAVDAYKDKLNRHTEGRADPVVSLSTFKR